MYTKIYKIYEQAIKRNEENPFSSNPRIVHTIMAVDFFITLAIIYAITSYL